MGKEDNKAKTVPPHEVYIDYSKKTDQELRGILEELMKEEGKISYQRRVLHGKIDILRAELVQRKKTGLKEGKSLISDEDIHKLSEILAGEALGINRNDPTTD
jgi:RsiG-like